jgi:hypothetical protein
VQVAVAVLGDASVASQELGLGLVLVSVFGERRGMAANHRPSCLCKG